MPQRKSSPEPKVMTWGKASFVLVAAVIFDLVRGFFQLFWFFGPAMAGLYCTLKVGDVWVVGKLLVAGCVALAGGAGVAFSEVTGPFGVLMADSIGLIAFLTLGLWIVITNERILKSIANAPLQFAGAFAIGEIPLIGAFPVFSVILWRLYSTQIRVEKAAHAKWEEEQATLHRQEQEQQNARLMQARVAQVAAANQQAANEAVYTEAANDEIPEQAQRAA